MAEEYNWRWIFYLLMPVCGLALLSILVFIRDSVRPEAKIR